MSVLGVTLQPGLAIAIGIGKLALDARDERPDPDAVGKVVMVATLEQIVGCARLTGVVTLSGTRWPDTEHPKSDEIREQYCSRMRGTPIDRACLWIYEEGTLFQPSIPVRAGKPGVVWTVPAEIENELREAYRRARERRAA